MMKKGLIATGIAVAIVIAIAGVYLSSLTEPTPEGAIESTTPQPPETTTQQTDEQPAVPTRQNITIRVEESLGMSEGP